MTTRTKRKIDAAPKAKIALEALREQATAQRFEVRNFRSRRQGRQWRCDAGARPPISATL
jgi:transposase-like protein